MEHDTFYHPVKFSLARFYRIQPRWVYSFNFWIHDENSQGPGGGVGGRPGRVGWGGGRDGAWGTGANCNWGDMRDP